VRLYYRN